MKDRLERFKQKAKDNAPTIFLAAYTGLAAAGWFMAGVYSLRLQKLEEESQRSQFSSKGWTILDVPPSTMNDLLDNGLVLKYRAKRIGEKGIYTQSTTAEDGFTIEADELFENIQ